MPVGAQDKEKELSMNEEGQQNTHSHPQRSTPLNSWVCKAVGSHSSQLSVPFCSLFVLSLCSLVFQRSYS